MFILAHFEHQNELFPRTIMTNKTMGQVMINCYSDVQKSIDKIYQCFKEANFVDCRINAFPHRTEYSLDLELKNKTPADFFMIDLDLKDFHNDVEKLDKTLERTVGKISQAFHLANPTVLWTGNGYHIYQPIAGFVLEKEKIFYDFVKHFQTDLTTQFLRFAGPFFTKSKQDKQHNPSSKSCLVRVPGTLNSKNLQEIKAIQKWDGNRPAINYVLRDFRRHLIQKRIDARRALKSGSRSSVSTIESSEPKTVSWIEKLLSTPIEDYRKYCIWRILCPYLINVRKTSFEDATSIIKVWLQMCDNLRKTDFNHNQLIKNYLIHVGNYLPLPIEKMRFEIPTLYKILT